MKIVAFFAEAETPEELEQVKRAIDALFDKSDAPQKTAKTRSEINKQNYERRKDRSENGLNESENGLKKSEKSEIQTKEERENEKEERKESTKEKKEESVKEKEELINIYAEPKVEKHRYGNFRHVLLSDDEYNRLHADFPDLQERIQRLDDYLENTGKVYKNHSLTIRNWANKDAQQGLPKQIPKEETFHDLKVKMERQQREQENVIDSFWRT